MQPIALYDCFSNQRFGGNVGGIVFDAADLDAGQMQKIARELNAAVTGFVIGRNGAEVTARFFMPGAEIAMCGHVTVGLFTHFADLQPDVSEFVLKAPAGNIPVRVTRNDTGPPTVMMQLSVPKPIAGSVDLDALADALGVPVAKLETRAPVQAADAGLKHLFVHLETLAEVQALAPDFQKLRALSAATDVQTIGCFSMQTQDPDATLHIRDFCPAVGVDEVPASGTTNGALAGYLVAQGFIAPNSQQISAEQGAEIGRPSRVFSEISVEQGLVSGLCVGGQAVASLTGNLA
ncbi:MAG: PhzF family phenazine biosynthesis protein [Rhodobacteraceae bacterium]|nr:PhzF family phenazine biosynthesis protein [Paracoccaceae bacterium]